MVRFTDDNPGAGAGAGADADAGTSLSEIAVDRTAEVPIGVQLAWVLRSRITDGGLPAGAQLPTLRELAGTTGVNVNTVRAVYQRLEQERLIESRQGSGTFVCDHTERAAVVGDIAALAASEAQSHGVDPRSVAAALYTGASSAGAFPEEQALARRHSLRAEIATLERAVAELQAGRPGVEPTSSPPRALAHGSGPRLLDAARLEAIRSELLQRLAALQSAIDDREATAHERKRTAAASAARSARRAEPRRAEPRRAERKPKTTGRQAAGKPKPGAAKRPLTGPSPA